MTGRALLVLDGDDTLWLVEHLYERALDFAQEKIEAEGLPGAQWRAMQRARDLENVKTMGMSSERFPRSSREALQDLLKDSEVETADELMEAVDEASRSVFTMRAPLVSGVVETLEALEPHFTLALMTKGDPRVQRQRIADSGLADYFEHVMIVPDKTEEEFRGLLAQLDEPPSVAWSVGNSLASDVSPALSAGLRAIWIDAHVWEHERREPEHGSESYATLENLSDLPHFLLKGQEEGTKRK